MREYDQFQLMDALREMCEIECSKCSKSSSADGRLDVAAEQLFDDGWRATAKNIYCPVCAKKYLKL